MNVDVSSRLGGKAKLPPGYKMFQLDSGHFIWECEETDEESCIHWNKWAVYRGAHRDHQSRQPTKQEAAP